PRTTSTCQRDAGQCDCCERQTTAGYFGFHSLDCLSSFLFWTHFMSFVLFCGSVMGCCVLRVDILDPRPCTLDKPVDDEQNNCSPNRSQKSCRVFRAIPAQSTANPSRECGPSNSEQDRNNETAWIPSRHQQFRNKSNNETHKNSD